MCVKVSLARNLIRVPKKICCASRCQSIVFFGDLMNFKNDKADRNRWRLRTRPGRELSLVCVEVSLARNEPSVRGGQGLTKTIGIKVCGSFCHRISVTRSP